MKMRWMYRATTLAALILLTVAGMHAQDATSSSDTQQVKPLFGTLSDSGLNAGAPSPFARPAARPRPATFFSGEHQIVLFGGYSALDSNLPEGNFGEGDCGLCAGRQGSSGFEFSGTYMFSPYFGLGGDFSAHFGSPIQNDPDGDGTRLRVDQNSYYFLFGPTVMKPMGRVKLFAHALVGVARLWAATDEADCSSCSFFRDETLPISTGPSVALGGGLDYMFTDHFGWRFVQLDWLWSRNQLEPGGGVGTLGSVSNLRISTGPVFYLGGMKPAPPNRPPTATCSVSPSSVTAGPNASVAVTATASDPDNDVLTYTWTATAGRVDGTGPQVRWLAAGAAPGTYTVTATVTDGRGGVTTCSSSPMVAAAPAPPPPPVNHPPTVTLTSDRDTVLVGERVLFTARGMDPDNDPVTYTWRANCGQLTPSVTTANLNTAGVNPGPCTVTVRVEDGRGGAADATKSITVQAPPPPPQASQLMGCDFKPATSTRVDTVCKRVLDDTALRLQTVPRATLVIIGFANPGGTADRTGGARANNAKTYLTDKGVDAGRITTRTGAGQAGGQNNSRIDIELVPEGATF